MREWQGQAAFACNQERYWFDAEHGEGLKLDAVAVVTTDSLAGGHGYFDHHFIKSREELEQFVEYLRAEGRRVWPEKVGMGSMVKRSG